MKKASFGKPFFGLMICSQTSLMICSQTIDRSSFTAQRDALLVLPAQLRRRHAQLAAILRYCPPCQQNAACSQLLRQRHV